MVTDPETFGGVLGTGNKYMVSLVVTDPETFSRVSGSDGRS